MSGSTDLEGVNGSIIALDLECARQAAGSPRFQLSHGVLRWEMRYVQVVTTAYGYGKGGQM